MTRYRTGLWAEAVAAGVLRLKGYKILARRYRTPVGEIDLVARRGGVFVFVEVKSRQNMATALESVQPRQMRRILRAAEHYMTGHRPGGGGADMRFDVIALAPPFRFRHIRGAFTA